MHSIQIIRGIPPVRFSKSAVAQSELVRKTALELVTDRRSKTERTQVSHAPLLSLSLLLLLLLLLLLPLLG